MACVDALIEKRIQIALAIVSRYAKVVSAYVFGSQVEGTTDQWSDIDIAVFIDEFESWDIHTRARIAAKVQKGAGDDIDVHFLSIDALQERDAAGFAAWVLNRGVEVRMQG